MYHPELYNRKSIRLKGYDYSMPGIYFVTLCVQDSEHLFGNIKGSRIYLNEFGKIIKKEWLRSARIRKEIKLDEYVIMPNHFHGIIEIIDMERVGANGRSPQPLVADLSEQNKFRMKPKSLSSFIAGFKSTTGKQINLIRNTPGNRVWQRNYYEHIVRNEQALNNIRQYIKNNPYNWAADRNSPEI